MSVTLNGQSLPWGEVEEINLAPALARAGIDRNDQRSLIRAIRHESAMVRSAALYGLGKLPTSPEAVEALVGLLDSPDETTLAMAASTLVALRVTGWTNRVLPRMGFIKAKSTELALWGNLAAAGEYSGWPVVKEALTGGGPHFLSLLATIHRFTGMRDQNGQLVDFAQELSIMMPRIPAELHAEVSFVIGQLRSTR